MKKIMLIAICSFFIVSCNMNPSKEARIDILETEMAQTIDVINKLEKRIELLEKENKQLKK